MHDELFKLILLRDNWAMEILSAKGYKTSETELKLYLKNAKSIFSYCLVVFAEEGYVVPSNFIVYKFYI